jgi:hypothetical protein
MNTSALLQEFHSQKIEENSSSSNSSDTTSGSESNLDENELVKILPHNKRPRKHRSKHRKKKHFSIRSQRQNSKGEESRKKLNTIQKTISRSESYRKIKSSNLQKSVVSTTYVTALCKSSNNIQDQKLRGDQSASMPRKVHIPLIREWCQRHNHKHAHNHQHAVVTPSECANSRSTNVMIGRKLTKNQNGFPKWNIARKYVKLTDTKNCFKMKPKAVNTMINIRGGSFDNRDQKEKKKDDKIIENPKQINQSENIIVEKNYKWAERSRVPLVSIENNLITQHNYLKESDPNSVIPPQISNIHLSFKSAYRNETYGWKSKSINSKSLSNSREGAPTMSANKELPFRIRKVKGCENKEIVANVLKNEKHRLKSIIKNASNNYYFNRLT